jgi:hypothetical protein
LFVLAVGDVIVGVVVGVFLGGRRGGGPAGGLNVLEGLVLALAPIVVSRGGEDEFTVGAEFKAPVNCLSILGNFSGV